MVAIFTPVFYQPHPDPAGLQGLPHFFEYTLRHIGVTYKIMVFVEKFFPVKTAHFHKGIITVGDNAALVGR